MLTHIKSLISAFWVSAGILLFITAFAKIVSSFGHVKILNLQDPLFAMSFKHLFWIVGSMEFTVAIVCILKLGLKFKAACVSWLATNFVAYRLGLLLIGYQRPCRCMGNLTDALHIPPQIADTAMKIILAYLLIGSYTTLLWLWWQRRNVFLVTPSSKSSASFGG